MFGAQVLIWTGLEKKPSAWQRLRHYFFRGSLGHSALKITLPKNAMTDALIAKYCKDEQGVDIPHYQVQKLVPQIKRNANPSHIQYIPKSLPAWEIYFSWWPTGLEPEHVDRLRENIDLGEADYDLKWQEYLQVQYKPTRRGLFYNYIGEFISNLIFGKPKMVPARLAVIVHPHPNKEQWMNNLKEASAEYAQAEINFQRNEVALKKCSLDIFLIESKLNHTSESLFEYVLTQFDQNYRAQKQEKLKQKLKDKEELFQKLALNKSQLLSLRKAHQSKVHDLERGFYKEVATIGLEPTETVFLPIQGIHGEVGLDCEQLLKSMRSLIESKAKFDFQDCNCSSTIYDILMSSIQSLGALCGQLPFSMIHTPDSLSVFSESLQKMLQEARFVKVNEQLQPQPDATNLVIGSTFIPQNQTTQTICANDNLDTPTCFKKGKVLKKH